VVVVASLKIRFIFIGISTIGINDIRGGGRTSSIYIGYIGK